MNPIQAAVVVVVATGLSAVLLGVSAAAAWWYLYWRPRQEHKQRIERVQHGLSEIPTSSRRQEPLPEKVEEICGLFRQQGDAMRRQCRGLLRSGAPEEAVERFLREEIEAQVPGLLKDLAI